MSNRLCFGRVCQLGWGYNQSMDQFIPIEEKPILTKCEIRNEWSFFIHPSSSTNFQYWIYTSLLLEPSCRKKLDFQITFDNTEYWQVNYFIVRQREECQKHQKYPSNCSHYVKYIDYGVDFRLLLPKTEFPMEYNQIKHLFEKRNFNEIQKMIKVNVMINYCEIRRITLGDFLQFINELHEGKYPQYDICIGFQGEKLNQEIQRTFINNQEYFGIFLSYLYSVYRKIEMKMEKARYPNILPEIEFNEPSLVKICSQLDKIKEEYSSMDRSDFLKMYPVLKKLFFCYTNYIKLSLNLAIDIDEGNYLPGKVDEIKYWFEKLNTWFPKNIDGKWKNCMGSYIGAPPNSDTIVNILRKTTKFRNSLIVNNERANEPYIGEENGKLFFGFVNMEGAETMKISSSSTILGFECPRGCTPHFRKWICTTCGEFVRSNLNSVGQQFLYCSCGLKKYKENLIICHHPSHQLQRRESCENGIKPITIKQEPISVEIDNHFGSAQNSNGTRNYDEIAYKENITEKTDRCRKHTPEKEPPAKRFV